MSIPGRGRVGAPGSGGDRASGLGDSQRLNLPGSSVLRITTFTSWHWPFFLGKRGRRGGSRETPELPPAHGILQDPLSAAPHSTLPRTLPPPKVGGSALYQHCKLGWAEAAEPHCALGRGRGAAGPRQAALTGR